MFSGVHFVVLCLFALKVLNCDDIAIFCFIAWPIWNVRNNYVFYSKAFIVKDIVERIGRIVGDYSLGCLVEKQPKSGRRDEGLRWKLTERFALKLNSDSAISHRHHC